MTRIEKLQANFPAGVDAFITTDEKTCFYLSEFLFSDGMMFVTRKDTYLFTDFRYIEAAQVEARGCRISTASRYEEIRKIIGEENVKTIGYEDDLLSVMMLERFKKEFPSCTFVPMGGIVRTLAEYKDEQEMELVRSAQAITDEAFAAVLPLLRPDMTETDVAAELEYQMKKRGASGTSFETIAVSGTNSARPHGVPRPVMLEKGFLTMDFGCVRHGYCSDMTRTVALGFVSQEMSQVYETVLRAQEMGIAATKAGVTGKEVDGAARKVITDAGYGAYFGHGFGHGLGVEVHEQPGAAPSCADPLPVGAVISAEPGIYLPGKFGVRIEDIIIIEEGGCRDIMEAPKDLLIL